MKAKRLVVINSYNCGSTGTIACKIADFAAENGFEVLKCFPKHKANIDHKKKDHCLFGIPFLFKINMYLTEATGMHGCFQFYNTLVLIHKLKKYNPSIVHLHNLHSSYVNIGMLFRYLKKSNVSVVWTLHDCWALTGHCAHFTISGCEKWMTGCYGCTNHFKDYPKALIDTSKMQWKRKARLFNAIDNLTLVTPSKWLENIVKHSFLNNKKIVVIGNGIDLQIFKPVQTHFREKYKISKRKYILLGVAFGWNYRKGLDVFIELAEKLDENYQIVLVGTDERVDAKLPNNIISIHRTSNQQELAEIYSAADLFVNPTREEMLGMVNIEANACGIPVITFNTGGSPECISQKSGTVYYGNTTDDLVERICEICKKKAFTKNDCLLNAKRFDQTIKYDEYLALYHEGLNNE